MKIICDKLLEIVLVALGKGVGAGEIVNFCRTYNDFIIDLGEVRFDWFVKVAITETECLDTSILQVVENKWSDSDNATYRVIKLNDFLDAHDPPPKHYTIDVINTLLSNILIQLGKNEWSPNNIISAKDQMSTSSSLISAIRSSLIYLAEQPDYVSFDRFYEERVNPFVSVVGNSSSNSDFTTRISLIKESFWYIRKQNEMSTDHALELFEKLNENDDSNLLRKAYNLYCEHFDKTMEGSMGKEHVDRVLFVAKQVKESVKQIHFKFWNSQFKQLSLPIILAKVAAVWTIQVSEDVSSTVGYFKPHCIQVLCVLRMLSADTVEEGVGKHFAQILTGQGKSLVLALTAAILALTGHLIDIVCYNCYLVKRDLLDFVTFFKVLEIKDNIEYNTFEKMANKLITLRTNDNTGKRVGIRELIVNQLLNKVQPSLAVADATRDKSILLIDEADVFFTKDFYGKCYFPAVRPTVPELYLIQEQVWKIVNECMYEHELEHCKERMLASDAFKNLKEFHTFIRESPYELLKECNDGFQRTLYSNKILFDEHLQQMVKCAWETKQYQDLNKSKFRLSEKETIHIMNGTGKYSNRTSYGYYNIFYYFQLKRTDFVPKIDDEDNYGYFSISCGAISYALLPLNYPLILGVTGTLNDLNTHERDAIENLYKIKQQSFMPSYFGCSNLRFDEEEDFHYNIAVESWMNEIYRHTYTEIAENRAVIIFFETDEKLENFHKEYSSKFDRINILTNNTKSTERVKFINEAGVAKTVTLATRQMGRGVDFKSSVVVEKNGGVHVIQTFFSPDVKEEIQIKGRTARKDNKGSYELIVSGKDLPEMEPETKIDSGYSYKILDKDRTIKSLKTNEKLAADIKQAQKNHELTMEYLKSFCEKK
ncbi:protein translocase subunit SecA 2-like isoform X1 [Culex pipiens pallens]|uniref:protein translocase subunit SecA 2-like isoform X1 n=1 Tax=Culex pipiens pallens TaxID=42434 RepID=UPI001953C5AE|nr:protein translocase subunit SecA 2-like isoform X1 [Culex pipiens pallens]